MDYLLFYFFICSWVSVVFTWLYHWQSVKSYKSRIHKFQERNDALKDENDALKKELEIMQGYVDEINANMDLITALYDNNDDKNNEGNEESAI